MFYAIFLFDHSWRIRWRRVALASPFVIFGLFYLQGYFVKWVSLGVYYNLDLGEKRVKELPSMAIYMKLIFKNLELTVSPFAQKDISNVLILLLEWVAVIFLLIKRTARDVLMRFWPLFIIPAIHFLSGIMTYYHLRYNLSVFAFFLFLLIFCASGVRPLLLSRYTLIRKLNS